MCGGALSARGRTWHVALTRGQRVRATCWLSLRAPSGALKLSLHVALTRWPRVRATCDVRGRD